MIPHSTLKRERRKTLSRLRKANRDPRISAAEASRRIARAFANAFLERRT